MAAAAVTLSGAYGELYVVWQNGEELSATGSARVIFWPLAGFLLLYAIVNLKETIEQGLLAPKPEPLKLSADAIAATVIASKLIGGAPTSDVLAEKIRDALKTEAERQENKLEAAKAKAKPEKQILPGQSRYHAEPGAPRKVRPPLARGLADAISRTASG